MADARVDLVLAGHTHVPTVTEFPVRHGENLARVVEVVCGTSTSTRTRGAPVSWMLVSADEAAITVTARVASDDGWYDGGQARFTRQHHPDTSASPDG
jgi:predicted phosphodiesterase